jgi:hypothetical protein
VLSDRASVALDRKYEETPFLNVANLSKVVLDIGSYFINGGSRSGIKQVDSSFTSFISQATEEYVKLLLRDMCRASEHRSLNDYTIVTGDGIFHSYFRQYHRER